MRQNHLLGNRQGVVSDFLIHQRLRPGLVERVQIDFVPLRVYVLVQIVIDRLAVQGVSWVDTWYLHMGVQAH